MESFLYYLRRAIKEGFVPRDQRIMEGEDMKCEIISSGKHDYILCRFDMEGDNKDLFPYFNHNLPALVSNCDYVLFFEINKRVLVFLIELKSYESPERQVAQSKPFAEFIFRKVCLSIIELEKEKAADDKTEIKGVQFYKIGIKKHLHAKRPLQGYRYVFNDDCYMCLPKPTQLKLDVLLEAVDF